MAISRFLRVFCLYPLAMLVLLFTQNTCYADDILTPAERAWLQTHPDIRVAVVPDYPPISFLDEQGKPTGLEHDYLSLIESRLGYQFKRVIPTLEQRAADKPADKHVDMIATFAATNDRLKNWTFTKPYLDFPVYLITQEHAPIQFSLENSQQQIISVVGHYAVYAFMKEKYPTVKIDKVDDTCIGLQHDQTASANQAILRHLRERSKNADMDCYLRIRPSRHREEKTQNRGFALHNITDTEPDSVRKNTARSTT